MTWMSLILTASLGQAASPPSPPLPLASTDFAALAANDFAFSPQALATASITLPQDAPASAPASSTGGDTVADSPAPPSSESLALNTAADNPFFQRGSWRWQITGAAATEFDDHFAFAGLGVSYFIEDNFTIDFELNGLYFLQSDEDDAGNEGDDTAGINLAMQLRWHFLVDDAKRWSIYLDTGFGVLFTGENVPPGGETFNFTPQAGIGFSMLLDEGSDARLLAGVKWHHTSNANLFEDNPGSNKIMVYAGFNFPF